MASPFKLSIHVWAAKHRVPIRLAITAHELAIAAEWLYVMMKSWRAGYIDAKMPARPDVKIWLRYYRKHRTIMRTVAKESPEVFGEGKEAEATLDFWWTAAQEWRNKPEEMKKELKKVLKKIGKQRVNKWIGMLWRSQHREYRRHLKSTKPDLVKVPDELRPKFMLEDGPEVHFILRIVLVCFVEYETAPIRLLRAARDFSKPVEQADAIEKLLRLDSSLAQDKKISKWVHGAVGSVRGEREQLVAKWMAEGLTGKFTRLGIKQSVAGLISIACEALGLHYDAGSKKWRCYRMSARQLKELFDAVAADRSRNDRKFFRGTDPDLDNSNMEAWQKAIQRHRKLWQHVLPRGVDTGKLSECP